MSEREETEDERVRRIRGYWQDAFEVAHAVKRSRTLQHRLGFRGRESFGVASHAYLVHGKGYQPPKASLRKAGSCREMSEDEVELPTCSSQEAARVLNACEVQDEDEPTLMSASSCRETSHWALVRTTHYMTHFLGYARQRQQAQAMLKLNREDSWRFNRLEGEGELDFYTSNNIMLRKRVKFDTRVVELLKELWDVVASELEGDVNAESLSKESFLAFTYKVALFLVPPPIHPDKLAAFAEEDWSKDSDASGNKMSPEGFCDSLFQVADVWTDSVEADEYVTLLEKIRDGITRLEGERRAFLENKDIKHDTCYADEFDVDIADDEVIVVDNNGKRRRGRISLLESQVHHHLSVMPMKIREVNKEISRIYDAYIRANLRANEREGHIEKGDRSKDVLLKRIKLALEHKRMDKFCVMFFQQKVGLRKIIRRSLRAFATSIKALQESHPRIKTFAVLCGLATDYTTNKRAWHAMDHFGDYYRPILRRLLYTNGKNVLSVFGEGSSKVWVSQRDFIFASTKNLRHVPQSDPRYYNFMCELGKVATKAFGKDVIEGCGVDDGTAKKHGVARIVVPLDEAVTLLRPLWEAEDDWRDFQPRLRAIVKLQKFYKNLKFAAESSRSLRKLQLESAKSLDEDINGAPKEAWTPRQQAAHDAKQTAEDK